MRDEGRGSPMPEGPAQAGDGRVGDGMAGSAGGAVEALPAATLVLVRDGPGAGSPPEVLMLRRVRTSGFVPGAWVFPGGRVDPADRAGSILERWRGEEGAAAEALAGRLRIRDSLEAAGYLNAALREALEETGIPVALTPTPNPDLLDDVRMRLLANKLDWSSTLEALGARVDASSIGYIGHWVTPLEAPRRYDTRFFLARVARHRPLCLALDEMAEGRWMTFREAVAGHADGSLPMVLPTIHTLRALSGLRTTQAMLEYGRSVDVPRRLPGRFQFSGG